MSKVFLYDFDGVLFKHPKASWYVSQRASAFVHKTLMLPGKQVTPYSELINKQLYTSHGHTVLGLRRMGYKVSMTEFNDFVYTDMPYSAYEEKQNWDIFDKDNVYIFSNAPSYFCNKIAKRDLPNIRDIINDNDTLKPEHSIYKKISHVFPDSKVYFVDDSFMNILPVMEDEQWVNILHVENAPTTKVRNNMYISGLMNIT